jgi:hypothetical protein
MSLSDEQFRARVEAATEPETWVVDGNYTVVWFDLPYLTVMARTIRRTVRRVVTREELWNGNREPLSNLWSFNPEKSIIAWTATRHRVYQRRYRAAEVDAQWSDVHFVRLGSQAAAEAFLAGVGSALTKEE